MTLKDDERQDISRLYMDKSYQALLTAEKVLEFDPGTSVSKSYYSMFYAAQAALVLKGIKDLKKHHKGVTNKFGDIFVKTGLVDAEIGKNLSRVEELRYEADYDLQLKFTPEKAKEQIDKAKEFVKVAEKIIQQERDGVNLAFGERKQEIRQLDKSDLNLHEENAKESSLKEEAQKNRIQAQQIQEMLSGVSRAYIFRGNDLNLQNANLNGVQENILAAADKAVLEVGDLRSAAADKEYLANSSDRVEAAGAARKIMGEKLILTDAEPGKTYDGAIIATTNTYAIQQISGNQAVLHEIKDIAKDSTIEAGKDLSITRSHEGHSTVREKSLERERARESSLEG